jgi:protein phosphatase
MDEPHQSAPVVEVPRCGLVVLVGVSGSGKSRFANRTFLPTEVLSSDRFRAMLSDDEADQSVSAAAFDLLYLVARRRLAAGRLSVVDATSVTPESRARLLAIAREADAPAVAVVFDVPLSVCLENDAARPGRRVGAAVIEQQAAALAASREKIADEGFARVYALGPDEVDHIRVVRTERS